MSDYNVNIQKLILTGLLGTILTAVVVVGLQVLYYRYEAGLETSEKFSQPRAELEALLDRQRTQLTDYRVVDGEKGIFAIPISRAMELVVDELSASEPDAAAEGNPSSGFGARGSGRRQSKRPESRTPSPESRTPSSPQRRKTMGRRHASILRALVILVVAAVWSAASGAARAQRKEPSPKELRDVGVTEHLNVRVPLDLEFVDSDGDTVTLGRFFDGDRPVVLTLNYSSCPMLCSLQLGGLFDGLKKMKWDIGDKFEMITVSIDPLETPERARMTKQKYLKIYRRPGLRVRGAAEGYHCLTGREQSIKKLADVVGFRYKYSPQTRQYAHAAVTMILTPDGRVSRYLYGVQYDPQTLRLSLLEAAEGKIGSTVDQILLFCFHYDPASGRYGPAAFRLMQFGGGLTVLILACSIWAFRLREKTKAHSAMTGESR